MKSSCLGSVAELVRGILSLIKRHGCLISCAVIVRALASMLQYVGLIKSEYLGTDAEFEEKFYELLRRYSVLSAKAEIGIQVRKYMYVFIDNNYLLILR